MKTQQNQLVSRIIVVALWLWGAAVLAACTTSVTPVYVLRHAEKLSGPNPNLTAAGALRAQELARILADVPIAAVYSTDTNRTRQTATPLANAKGLEVQLYQSPADVKDIVEANKGNVIVIVGHSNTVPDIVGQVGGELSFSDIPDSQFDNLFLLVVKHVNGTSPKLRTQVLHMKYGGETP